MENVDVLIIGAGPAGSIAASLIHQAGLKARVVEKEKFPRFVIGESLLPRCMEVLEEAKFLNVLERRGFQKKFGAKFVLDEKVADYNFSDQFTNGWSWTWQVPRADFDTTLIEEVQRMGVPVQFEKTVSDIQIGESETSVTTVVSKDGAEEKIRTRFIIDASGYGRVIPRLFKLEKTTGLDPRKAVFAHVTDEKRNNFDEPNRIIIVSYAPGVWAWVIPFSNGNTSLGFVGSHEFFKNYSGASAEQFEKLINGNTYLKKRFENCSRIFEPRVLESWSSSSSSFHGKGFVLTGNVTEFLDPIFSSGVMFAVVSSQLASKLVIRKLKGETIDWVNEYEKIVNEGVDTFRSYVVNWYDGTLEKIFFAANPDPLIKKQITSILGGYVWDQTNAYVRDHQTILKKLARKIEMRDAANM